MKQEKIKFGLAGFGHIGRRHAAEILAHAGAELMAVADIDPIAAKEAALSFGVKTFPTIEEMLVEGEYDVVSICTPNGYHVSHAKLAVKAGTNVLIEKPIGLHSSECESLLSLAELKGKEVFCVLQNRYSPPARFLREMVDAEKLGKIYWVEVSCYWNRDDRYYRQDGWRGTQELDGGTLFTQFSHFVDLLYWAFGDVKPVQGYFANFSHSGQIAFEDTGSFHFEAPAHRAAGVFNYSTTVWDKNMESSITVIGSRGTLRIAGQYMNQLDFFHVEGEPLPELPEMNPPNQYGAYQGSASNHAFVIDNLVKALRGEPHEIATGRDAMASVKIIEQVYKMRSSTNFV